MGITFDSIEIAHRFDEKREIELLKNKADGSLTITLYDGTLVPKRIPLSIVEAHKLMEIMKLTLEM